MPAWVSGGSWADLPGVSIETDSEVAGLGVRSLLTPVLGDVWRTGPGTSAATVTLNTDTDLGGTKGAATTRLGGVSGPDSAAATAYSNSVGSSFVRPGAFSVAAGYAYEISVPVRLVGGAATNGWAIIAEYQDASGAVVRSRLPASALVQTSDWQVATLRFSAGRAALATIYLMADTGALGFELAAGQLVRQPGQRSLNIDLGEVRPVRAVVLTAPRDGLLPAPGDMISAALSATVPGGTDGGALIGALVMPRGYWCWILPAEVQARYLRLILTSSQPYLQFGRLWLDAGVEYPRFLAEQDFEPSLFDDTAQPVRRRVQVALSGLTEAEADSLESIGLAAGTQRQVLVIPRTERADRTAIIGKFTALPAPRPRQAWNQRGQLHTATLAIQEDR